MSLGGKHFKFFDSEEIFAVRSRKAHVFIVGEETDIVEGVEFCFAKIKGRERLCMKGEKKGVLVKRKP